MSAVPLKNSKNMNRQIVLDTETTGLVPEEGHRIIEIGCIEIINRRQTKSTFQQYINPERTVEYGALAVHGLNNEFLQDKPTFAAIAADFLAFIADAELIIHNAPFDLGFLRYEFNLLSSSLNFTPEKISVIDTLEIARKLHPGQRNNLDALCKRYKIDNSKREFHGALLDAQLLAEVYLRMTGGQGSLFGEGELINEPTIAQKKLRKTSCANRPPVIYASAEELVEHQKYLEKMQKISGKCLYKET